MAGPAKHILADKDSAFTGEVIQLIIQAIIFQLKKAH